LITVSRYINRPRTIYTNHLIKPFTCPTNAHTNYSKIVELLKRFKKTTIIATTCFGLHKLPSGSSQSLLRRSYNIYFSVYMSLMKFSVLWLHILFRPVLCVCRINSARCTHTTKYAATAPKTSLTTCIH
jgi:hypothetical protein